MCQFFESICVKDGVLYNLSNHQLRVNKSLRAFNTPENTISLSAIVNGLSIPSSGWYKLRISYALSGAHLAEFVPYQFKTIATFSLVDIHGQHYNFKWNNRDWINEALKHSGKDEIIMHDQGLIKDSSYANIVFNDGINWVTPEAPLLEGTQRAKLIQDGMIKTGCIHIESLPQFQSFKLINAMLDWENAINYPISLIL